ncbi:MAG: glycosyltransferase family 9 protein [Desulfonauticus sp.]|nr:glycosyltransferase family 9 protein [Desulfonauticus sp.]
MKKVLVINLTRFGDILQSQPLLSLVAQENDLALCCLEYFINTTEFLTSVDTVFSFPGTDVLRYLDQGHWQKGLNVLLNFVNQIKSEFNPDEIINLTPSLPARLFTLFFPETEKKGFFLDKLGFAMYSNDWAAFLQAASSFRELSPLNLVDLNLGLVDPKRAQKVKFVLKNPDITNVFYWQKQLRSKVKGQDFIGFQLGASAEKRRWPVEYFVRLGEKCYSELKLVPVLLGSKHEIVLGQKFERLANFPVLNLIGKTSLKDLACILKLVKYLVTNDTGTMHLAAGLGTKIIAIFLATAQAWDTGPYLESCLCLEPNMDCHPCSFQTKCKNNFTCRFKVLPEYVFQCIKNYNLDKINTSDIRLYRVGFKKNLYFLQKLSINDNRYEFMRFSQDIYYNFIIDNNDYDLDLLKIDINFKEEIDILSSYFLVFLENLKTLNVNINFRKMRNNKIIFFYNKINSFLMKSKFFVPLYYLWLVHSQQYANDLEGLLKVSARYFNFFNNLLRRCGN